MTDTIRKDSPLGEINISREAIGQIVQAAAAAHDGKVYLANRRGRTPGAAAAFGVGDDIDNIDIEVTGEGVTLTVYLIVRFGASIREVTTAMQKQIAEQMEILTGEPPLRITLVVVGTLSRQIARRHIEVVWERGAQ